VRCSVLSVRAVLNHPSKRYHHLVRLGLLHRLSTRVGLIVRIENWAGIDNLIILIVGINIVATTAIIE